MALLIAAIVLQALDSLATGPGLLLIFASLAVGAAGAWAYANTRLVPAVLSVLSPLSVLFVAYFLLLSPVSDLVLPQDVEAAGSGQGRSATPVVFVVFDEFSGASLEDSTRQASTRRVSHTSPPSPATPPGTGTQPRSPTRPPRPSGSARGATSRRGEAARSPRTIRSTCSRHSRTAIPSTWSSRPAISVPSGCALRYVLALRSRLRSLADDLSVVSSYLLLPEDLEEDLPKVDRTFAASARADGTTRRAALDAGIPVAAAREPSRSVRAVSARHRRTDIRSRSSTSCTSPFPTFPWQYLPFGQSYDVIGDGSAGPVERALVGRRVAAPAGLSALPASAGLRRQGAGAADGEAACRGPVRPFADRRDR